MSTDASTQQLTDAQVLAAARSGGVFIEAHPGSGKTTVAARRFGALRFGAARIHDARPVVAVSFTRSATTELRRRVLGVWGTHALAWPNRIDTIDALVCDLVEYLLATNEIAWPGGHKRLDVRDSWSSVVKPSYTDRCAFLALSARTVCVRTRIETKKEGRVTQAQLSRHAKEGICTHEDVRSVLAAALAVPQIRARARARLGTTMRALIVDEVFDANELDLSIIELAGCGGVDVTLIGDPWQALYEFRGARPELVPAVVERLGLRPLPLTQSFRWQTTGQSQLADDLRSGVPVALPGIDPATDPIDVVLGCKWNPLWDAGAPVLPLSFSGAKGTHPEAAATVVLGHVTRSSFGRRAVDATDAISLLQLDEAWSAGTLTHAIDAVVQCLRDDESGAESYVLLAEVVGELAGVDLPKTHANYRRRLQQIRERLVSSRDLVPGLTIHHAKGRQWDFVAVDLEAHEVAWLATGLSNSEEDQRKLYVACTRARRCTFVVDRRG